jgi:hypothetical protein
MVLRLEGDSGGRWTTVVGSSGFVPFAMIISVVC